MLQAEEASGEEEAEEEEAEEASGEERVASEEPRSPKADQTHRVRIKGHKLYMTDVNMTELEVLPLGGNYVIKAQPYFPSEDVVRANARSMFSSARNMTYKPSDGRKVIPVVRLGAMMEGAMPRGPKLDAKWTAALERTGKIFAEEGVYVVVDSHSDCWSSSNGGGGFPFWIPQYFQKTSKKESYVISPEHPLKTVIPKALAEILTAFNVTVPTVQVVENDTNPWFKYSVDDKEPWKMNVGNLNVRRNNNDEAWGAGVLPMSLQSNTIAHRFYNSWRKAKGLDRHVKNDREQVFKPFVEFMKYLATVWQDNPNVIAVEIMNEPTVAGLPSDANAVFARRNLFSFYGELLKELDSVPAVYALEDILGGVPGGSPTDMALGLAPIEYSDVKLMKERAQRGQLMFSFHYYYGMASVLTFEDHIKAAMHSEFGHLPMFLSEYWDDTAKESARKLTLAAEMGVNIVTLWHLVDSSFTQTDGWFKYPAEVQAAGGPEKAWEAYSQTVANGTHWGAAITGSGGGKTFDILRLCTNPVGVTNVREQRHVDAPMDPWTVEAAP